MRGNILALSALWVSGLFPLCRGCLRDAQLGVGEPPVCPENLWPAAEVQTGALDRCLLSELKLRSRSSCSAAGAREVALRGRGAAASQVVPGKRLQPAALCKTFVFKMHVMGKGERWKDVG